MFIVKALGQTFIIGILVSISGSTEFLCTDSKEEANPACVSSVSNECKKAEYVHKSRRELDVLSLNGLFQELVIEEANHKLKSWSDEEHDDEYPSRITGRILMQGPAALTVLNHAIEQQYTNQLSICSETKLAVAVNLIVAIDRDHVRLRNVSEGAGIITSLERRVGEMKNAGLDGPNHPQNALLNIYKIYLEALKGVNETDRAISDTLWVKKKIKMTSDELSQFSDFLTDRHPDYPSWSETELIKDVSRLNAAGNPLQVFILKNHHRIFQAYTIFRKLRLRSDRRDVAIPFCDFDLTKLNADTYQSSIDNFTARYSNTRKNGMDQPDLDHADVEGR